MITRRNFIASSIALPATAVAGADLFSEPIIKLDPDRLLELKDRIRIIF